MNELPEKSNSILPAVGIHKGIDYEDYAAWPAIRQSVLKPFRRSPLHAKHAMAEPRKPSSAMVMGTALHAAVYEPAKFKELLFSSPSIDGRTKEGKALKAKAEEEKAKGKIVMPDSDTAIVWGMAEAIRLSQTASAFTEAPGNSELSCLWRDDGVKLLCKARFDRLVDMGGVPVIVDLKTTRDAGETSFMRDAFNLGYAIQGASYVEGHKKATGEEAEFVIIAVENTPPFGVAVYMFDDESMRLGRIEYHAHLDTYAKCAASDDWPGYRDEVQVVNLPSWGMRQLETKLQEEDENAS